MKKLFAIFTILLLPLGLTACVSDDVEGPSIEDGQQEENKEVYTVTYVVEDGTTKSNTKDVTEDSSFELEVPTLNDSSDLEFVGWFTEENASGTQLTNESGKGLVNWNLNKDVNVYAHFASVELTYELLSDNTYCVYGDLEGSDIEKLFIPQYYNNKLITQIGSANGAFINYSSLTDVLFYDTVEIIDLNVFNMAYFMENYTVLNTNNRNAEYCSVDGVIYSSDLETLVKYPISNPRVEFTVPEGTKTIETNAFYNTLTGEDAEDGYDDYYGILRTINFSDSLENIKDSAFYNTGHLQNLNFSTAPKSGVDLIIGDNAFYNCRVTSLELPSNLKSIGDNGFYGDSSLYIYLNYSSYLNKYPDYKQSALILPDSLESIGSYAFFYHTWINDLYIPNSVKEIGAYGFHRVTAEKIEFESNSKLTRLSEYVFANCTKVTDIVLPDSLEYIDSYALSSMSAITSITLPNSMKVVGSYGIHSNSKLTEIILNEGLLVLEDYAFSTLSKLTSINLPSTLTKIGYGIIESCTSLTIDGISIAPNLPIIVEDGVIYSSDYTNIILYSSTKTDSTFTIPNGVEVIPGSLFKSNTHLTEVIIPDSVKEIGSSAFSGCSNLTSIILPSGLESMGQYTFQSSGLTSITIPASVSEIGMRSFYSATSLETVIFEPNSKLTNFTSNLFYKTTALRTFVWPDNLKTIEFAAFTQSGIETISIPNTVVSVEYDLFLSCANLTELTIPASLKHMDYNIVASCTNLTTINIDSENTSFKMIDGHLYSYDGTIFYSYLNTNKTSDTFVIPNTVTTILAKALIGSTFTELVIPSSVTSIASGTFSYSGSSALKTITINSQAQLDNIIGETAVTGDYAYLFKYCTTVKVVEGLDYSNTNIEDIYTTKTNVDGYDVFTK